MHHLAPGTGAAGLLARQRRPLAVLAVVLYEGLVRGSLYLLWDALLATVWLRVGQRVKAATLLFFTVLHRSHINVGIVHGCMEPL